jgi:hypothetical protein
MAASKPLPFWVRTWMTTGPSQVFGELQHADERGQVVTVEGPEIAEAELLEDQAAAVTAAAVGARAVLGALEGHVGHHALEGFLGLLAEADGEVALGQLLDPGGEIALQLVVAWAGGEAIEVGGDGADVLGDGPLVVVEDADELLGGVGDVVQRLERDAVGEGGVAEDADHVFVGAALVAGGAHAERGGQRGAGVAGAVAVVFALGAQGEAVQAVGGADGVETVLSAGQELVDVDLMADVPDEFVLGRGEGPVQGDGQLDHAEVGSEVAAVFGKLGDQLMAESRWRAVRTVRVSAS